MKRTKLIVFLIALTLHTSAQTGEEVKTLFGNGKLQLGYFINPSIQVGKSAGFTAVLPKVGVGIVVNNQLYISLLYKFIANENTPKGEDTKLYLDEQYGGVRFEFSIKPDNAVHVNFPIEAGVGHVELDLKDSYEGDAFPIPSDDASFAYFEPGVAVEINIWKYIKLDLSAGYRLLNKLAYRSITEKDLMGLTYSAALKIGIF